MHFISLSEISTFESFLRLCISSSRTRVETSRISTGEPDQQKKLYNFPLSVLSRHEFLRIVI